MALQRTTLAALVYVVVASTAWAGAYVRPDFALADEVDRIVEDEMAEQEVVGVAVGILHDGDIAYLKGYGYADRENEIPVDRNTMFRWASVSKTLAGTLAAMLWEDGALNPDRDIREYVPEYPDKGVTITPRHLLGHLGGIVHYTNAPVVQTSFEWPNDHPFEDVVLALNRFKESPLVNQPGEKYSYTTHGYILLSAVLERAGEEKFADQINKRISEPLGLRTLQPDYQWVDIPHRAVGYQRAAGAILRSGNTDVSWKLGGGGWISNIDDMAVYARGHLRRALLKPGTYNLVWTPMKTNDGEPTNYGWGFGVSGEGQDLQVSHGGSQQKAKTYWIIEPYKNHGVVFMSNSEYCNQRGFVVPLMELLRAQSGARAADSAAVAN